MSDEIDIEEHDVMDNPTIKRIFPDLSVIKKEINQYYDDDLNPPSETAPLEILSEEDAITEDSEVQLPEYNIHDSNKLVTTSLFHASEATETQKTSRYLHENIIILGTKPNLKCQKNNLNCFKKEPKLILKNIITYLGKCNRYCKECLILFPRKYLFDLHLTNIHTAKNNEIECMGRKVGKEMFKCNACNRLLSSRSNLFRHFRNLHGDLKISMKISKVSKICKSKSKSALKTNDRTGNKIVAKETSQSNFTGGLSCFHCQKLFSNQNSLIEHLYEVLDPNKTEASDESASNAKELNKEVNLNDQLMEDNCVKHINESNAANSNNFKINSRLRSHSKGDTGNGVFDSIQPQESNPKSEFELAEYHDVNIKKIKRTVNSHPLHNGDINSERKLNTKEFTEQVNSDKKLKNHIRKERFNNTKNMYSEKPKHTMFYKCFICSKYNATFKFYSRHIINDHKLKKVTEIEKVPFNSQCKFCSSNLSGIYAYNLHLFKYHKEQLNEAHVSREEQAHLQVDKKIQFALKSILYKCMKCDLFFLSSNAAIDHSSHAGITDTWKCSVCQIQFRKDDMALHEKQHAFSKTFTVHSLAESAFSYVLYKCSMCTIHYSEENFMLHYIKCDLETPNSFYCKVCDILINRDDMESHGIHHTEKKQQYCDFIIIESDMIDDLQISPETAKSKNDQPDMRDESHKSTKTVTTLDNKSEIIDGSHISLKIGKKKNNTSKRYRKTRSDTKSLKEQSKLAMTFCQTCRCFLGNVNLRKLHVEGRCGHMVKYVCKYCGLLLTPKIHATHIEYHKKQKITLHDFVFYDLKSEKRICPPIPEYPNCRSCGVHFLRKSQITIHSCQEQVYVTCNVCFLKLTEEAYKLHVHFHSYSIPIVKTKLKDMELVTNTVSEMSHVRPNLSSSDNSNIADVLIYYTCKSCKLTVCTYDKVVQHCQDHYDSEVIKLNTQKCQNCTLILHRSAYENHNNMLHINGKYNKHSIKVVDFDPFYFRYSNDFWTKHIFAYVSDENICKILKNSIYRYECRLKLEESQSGSSNSVLYKCDKCQVFIDPQYMYIHAVNSGDKTCVTLRKHPCSLCGLSFVSLAYRIAHEKEHDIKDMNLKSYKIVLYNKEEHEPYNKVMYDACNRYILYQCRNCERVVDKFERHAHKCDESNLQICSACGLLFDKQDFDLHFIRHEELDRFKVQNIFVVMFGKPNLGNKSLRSTFNGTKYDYTMYKCTNCDLCLRKKKCTSEHVCVFDNSKCSKCGLCFSKQDLILHYKMHESNLGIDVLNMNIINFDASSAQLHGDPKDKSGETNNIVNQAEEVIENTSFCAEKQEIIYKCNCGLHFLEELNAQRHANICKRMKISKQNCFKCDLLFTPGELFNHLLKHHCDKKLQFSFDVVLVSKKEPSSFIKAE